MDNLEFLWNKIKDYGVISFDFFDTLVKRNVSMPKVIFDIVEMKYNQKHGVKISDFTSKRIKAEKIARHKLQKQIILDEIYEFMDLSAENKLEIKQIEIDVEKEYCQANYKLKSLYDRAVRSGKHVVIVSDMYLPSVVLGEILDGCGYTGFEHIYVSGECNTTKRRGKLFRHVLDCLKVSPQDFIHIGDDLFGDYLVPKMLGINALFISKRVNNTLTLGTKAICDKKNVLYAFINNKLGEYADKSIAFRLGYETLGPMVFGYTEWVHRQITVNDIEHAYFIARDMYLFYKLYKLRYGRDGISYLEISRRSMRKAYLVARKDVLSCKNTLPKSQQSDEEFAKALGISLEKWLDLKNTNNVDDFKEEAEITKEYLRQEGFFNYDKIATVDIGWIGTAQHALETIIGKSVKGLYWYICLRESLAGMDVLGYHKCCNSKSPQPEILGVSQFLESLLFPAVGTTVGYEINGDKVVPIYADCEMASSLNVEQFHQGTEQFVKDCIGRNIFLQSDDFSLPFLNMAKHPGKKLVEIFKDWCFEENMRVSTISLRPLSEYLHKPALFVHDLQQSFWKEGFLAQVLPEWVNPSWITRVLHRVIWLVRGKP